MTKTRVSRPVFTGAFATVLAALALLLAPRPCRANGFLIYDISGSGMARAGKVSSRPRALADQGSAGRPCTGGRSRRGPFREWAVAPSGGR